MKRSVRDTEESARIISRRGLILAAGQAGLVAILGLRMRQLQINEAAQYRLLAEENRINIRLIAPVRGLIFDRNGSPIAQNEQNYRVVIVREEAGDVDQVLERLSKVIDLTPEQIDRARADIKKRSAFVPVQIADRLNWDEISAVAVNAPALPGVSPEVGLSRVYPHGEDTAHIAGYVGPVSDYDLSKLEDRDPVLQIPEFQIGKTGVEAKLERTLRGQAGSKRIEVNAVGRVMRELDRDPGVAGADLQLTLDNKLQNFVQARLAGESAAVVVMDVNSGDLLAMGSAPSFDPNKFVRGISGTDYGLLTGNKYRPLANKSAQGTYPPGSTFKMVTALAALEDGLITPDETIYCRGFIELGNRRFHCWKRAGHGQMNLNDGLAQSCDVYYYELAQRVGIEKITAMANRLGLGIRHPVPISAVAKGLTPTKAWKKEHRGSDWVVGDSLNSAIGQGFVLASPLQLAVMTARIASGRAVEPKLIKSVNGVEVEAPEPESLGLNENNLRMVRRAMFNVSNNKRGTAFRSRIIDDAFAMAGKTGTSQVRNITAEERRQGVFKDADLPWERRDHALFVNFAPFDVPRIAVSVVVEHGGGGSVAAAPIARDVTLFALTGGMPPLEAYPKRDRPRIEREQSELPLGPINTEGGASRA